MKRRAVRRVQWALVACLVLFAVRWLPAEAHAELLSAYPAPGSTLDSTPPEIRLTFSERIGPGSNVRLFGPQFRAVPGVQSGLDPAAPEQLRAFPPRLSPDTYTVQWSAVSVDGHEVSGSYAFAVTPPRPPPPAWLLVAALLAVLAVGGAAWQIVRGRRGGRSDTRAEKPKGNLS
jgi:methionine-rich copper-binding protein CopC